MHLKIRIISKMYWINFKFVQINLLFLFLFFFWAAGAYYPAQSPYSTTVQPAPVMISPAQHQQQAPPPQQLPPQPQGPPKRERKQVVFQQKSSTPLVKHEWIKKCGLCSMWNFPLPPHNNGIVMLGGNYRSGVTECLHSDYLYLYIS